MNMTFAGQKRLHSERQQMGVFGEIQTPNELLKRKKLIEDMAKERVLPSPFASAATSDNLNRAFFS